MAAAEHRVRVHLDQLLIERGLTLTELADMVERRGSRPPSPTRPPLARPPNWSPAPTNGPHWT